jgi:hypothetical protein
LTSSRLSKAAEAGSARVNVVLVGSGPGPAAVGGWSKARIDSRPGLGLGGVGGNRSASAARSASSPSLGVLSPIAPPGVHGRDVLVLATAMPLLVASSIESCFVPTRAPHAALPRAGTRRPGKSSNDLLTVHPDPASAKRSITVTQPESRAIQHETIHSGSGFRPCLSVILLRLTNRHMTDKVFCSSRRCVHGRGQTRRGQDNTQTLI